MIDQPDGWIDPRRDPTTADFGQHVGRAYFGIRDLIVHGRLPAGSRVVESDLAVRLSISRTPVREALARLEHEGFVIPAGRGQRKRLIVAPLSAADFHELCQLMGAYESLALAGIGGMPAAWRDTLATRLTGINQALEEAMSHDPRDSAAVFELQTRFHTAFFDALAGPRLRATYGSIRALVERYEWAHAELDKVEFSACFDEHTLLVAAIRAGIVEAAQAAVQQHWRHSAARVARALHVEEMASPNARVQR